MNNKKQEAAPQRGESRRWHWLPARGKLFDFILEDTLKKALEILNIDDDSKKKELKKRLKRVKIRHNDGRFDHEMRPADSDIEQLESLQSALTQVSKRLKGLRKPARAELLRQFGLRTGYSLYSYQGEETCPSAETLINTMIKACQRTLNGPEHVETGTGYRPIVP
jgi:hypothetical protein